MGDLSPHFSRIEFACKCGCGFNSVHPELINMLEQMRMDVNEGIFVTSGCRCPDYNRTVGGVENSAHTRGTAADIRLGYMYGPQKMKLLRAAVRNNALGIGIADNFFHVDTDEELPRPAAWVY